MDPLTNALSNGMTLMVIALLVLMIAYRYYSAFLAAKVLALDPRRTTPAHTLADGHNYHPTNKWVLFGHHFAAISGAGPLIGPVLAAQFGFLPGYLWILIGVVLAGAVQDFTVLALSVRRNGKSLAQIAFLEAGPVAGTAATIGILFVLVIALAGLGKVVTKALGGETIPYPAGTQFLAPDAAPIIGSQPYGNLSSYRIPAGTTIRYPASDKLPNGATETVATRFDLESAPKDPDSAAIDLDPHDPGLPSGAKLLIPTDVSALRKIPGSSWGTFTIALTIPIALFTGWYIYRLRKGRVVEGSILGGLLTLAAVYLGGLLDGGGDGTFAAFLSSYKDAFNLADSQIGIAMAVYGFVASVLPVWILLCPRDYLSSFLKIGTVLLLVIGVIIARPHLHAPAINYTFIHGGPAFKGSLFPFVFIVIMCGAISGFHALVSSGTTPKMLSNEKDARTIGYGAMLIEGLVGIIALIAATALPTSHYYHIQTDLKDLPAFQQQIAEIASRDEAATGAVEPPARMSELVGENVQGRTGGAVTLAVGMARIFDDASKNLLGRTSEALEGMFKYWYHFAIMFEALFILTTIDTGTRVGRFLIQETLGKWVHPKLGKVDYWPSALLATALMVGGWWYFLSANAMQAIWPMFGIANQMLAVMALAIVATALARNGKRKYLWVPLLPMAFVTLTTTTAAAVMLKNYFSNPTFNNVVSALCTLAILLCTALVVTSSFLSFSKPPTLPDTTPTPEELPEDVPT